MSINDPITIEFDEKRQKYFLKQGNETFYDDNNEWIMFDTEEEAQEYLDEGIGESYDHFIDGQLPRIRF